MAASAVVSGTRSMLRAASSRNVAASTARFASQAKSAPPMFRATARRNPLLSPLRNPVELSCVESMLPYHTATASALMTSMLSISGHTYGWLSDELFLYLLSGFSFSSDPVSLCLAKRTFDDVYEYAMPIPDKVFGKE